MILVMYIKRFNLVALIMFVEKSYLLNWEIPQLEQSMYGAN